MNQADESQSTEKQKELDIFKIEDVPVDADKEVGSYVEKVKNTQNYASRNRGSGFKSRDEHQRSFQPKKPVEEFDNYELPLAFKTRIDAIESKLASTHKENSAIAYAIGISNEAIAKLQKDLIELAEVVGGIQNSNPYLAMVEQTEEEKLLSRNYDSKLDIDSITNNVLVKMKENAPNQSLFTNKKESKKKKYLFYALMFFLVATNTVVSTAISKVINAGSKSELVDKYKTKKGDRAICKKPNGETTEILLKEDVELNVARSSDGTIQFFINDFSCNKR